MGWSLWGWNTWNEWLRKEGWKVMTTDIYANASVSSLVRKTSWKENPHTKYFNRESFKIGDWLSKYWGTEKAKKENWSNKCKKEAASLKAGTGEKRLAVTEPRCLEEWPCRAGGQTPRAAPLVLLPQKLREEALWGQGVGLLGWEVGGAPLLVRVFLRRCSGKKLETGIYCGCQIKSYCWGGKTSSSGLAGSF